MNMNMCIFLQENNTKDAIRGEIFLNPVKSH